MTVVRTQLIDGPFPRGAPGQPGVYVFPAWVAGQLYPPNAFLPHLNCIWRANRRTTQAPAFALGGAVASADWDLWIDGRGADQASVSAAIAVEKAAEAAGYAAAIHPGAANGVAQLDGAGHVPQAQLSAAVVLALLNAVIGDLPAAAPAGGGLWNNGGVLCVAPSL